MVPRPLWIAGPAILLLVSFAALIAALAYGGGADAPALVDPGPVVLYGLPIAKLLVNLGGGVTVGALVLTAFALDPKQPEFGRALDVAAASAALWTVASAVTGFLIYTGNFTGGVSLDPTFGQNLGRFLTDTELGQAWLATTLFAAAVTVLCFAVRNLSVLVAVLALAVAGLYPMASQGHVAGAAGHNTAVTALFLHVLFAGVWLGGFVTLAILRPVLGRGRLEALLPRYSTVALVSFVVVAVSGYLGAQLRIAELGNLLSPYGILILTKTAALLVLGLFGAVHRRVVIDRMRRSVARASGWFWWLVAAELGFMGIASGVAAALARTPTPVPEIPASELTAPTPAEILTGSPLPPPISATNLLTLWNIDLLWLLICAFGVFFYLAGVWRLHRRGDRWPVHRTVLWVLGMLLLFVVTNGGVNLYQEYLFSAHMLAHMTLGMMVPVLLVPGAPITLAMRAIVKRTDGSRGPREWISLIVHSRYLAIIGHPLVAAVLFVGSLWVFYYTPLFRWATTDHLGHEWMIVHFLAVGYLFVQALIGIDPAPNRPSYPVRLLLLLATMAAHAFFGLALITGTGLLLADWYGAMGWGTSAIADQQVGGGIAWSIGEAPTVALAIIVAILWYRDGIREAKRYDRKADRDGDAELAEYNAMLAARADRD
ncbi:cytochrome c oxidase assembly protein [Leifsonia sp. H3M29-4]|uniref:cytochrome c oxidase assembly protein n=1 Tax=Salinibacterium metalliresistens TaxID=3031321 RepID=UPI0023DC3D7D|nr:cytochrome c oxidase assembly protein [Salinibacterium metalliresistens]MDF1477659.1 cytochrome c oxidase assembly protein [Salinibacterium metalliresistens]